MLNLQAILRAQGQELENSLNQGFGDTQDILIILERQPCGGAFGSLHVEFHSDGLPFFHACSFHS
jgi:hypothetical protein